MKHSIFALILGLYTVLSAAVPTPDDGNPDFSQVYIEGITYAGTGCKEGSVAYSKSDDWKTVTFTFDGLVASTGPSIPITENRKICKTQVKLHYPPGWQYAVYKIDYTGYAIPKEDTLTVSTSYWFAGAIGQRAVLKGTSYGKRSKGWSFADYLKPDAYVWSPCGASTTLNIDTLVMVDGGKDTKKWIFAGPWEDDDNKTFLAYGLIWRGCTK